MTPFVATEAFEPSHPRALAVYCSDGRFTNAVEELLHRLGHPRVDTVTLPGGPALFNVWLAGFSDSDAITRGTSFLIEAHGIEQVALFAHEGCGFYKARMAGASAEQIREHQIADLRVSAGVLLQRHPRLKMRLYHAVAHKNVTFHEVPLSAR